MKIPSKFLLISSAAVVSASPLVMAAEPVISSCQQGPGPELIVPLIIVDPVVTEPKVVDVKVEPTTKDEGPTGTEATGGEKTDEGEFTGGDEPVTEVTVTGEEVPTTAHDDAVPLDWVKRGGGENPEIFQNMAGGGAPVLEKTDTSVALFHNLGQDDKAAAIEAKGTTGLSQIKGEKKETQALVKKGRVFLR